jgi:hypothetical protein
VRARKQPPPLAELIEAVEELHKRIRREIERCESPRRGQGTALTGGWAKIGNRTQTLLCATIEWIALSENLDAVDALRKESPRERTLEEASFLTLGGILKGFAKLETSKSMPVHRIVHDVASTDSLIAQLTRKRRDKVHEREEEVQVAQDLRELRRMDEFLRRVRDDLRTNPARGRRGARS